MKAKPTCPLILFFVCLLSLLTPSPTLADDREILNNAKKHLQATFARIDQQAPEAGYLVMKYSFDTDQSHLESSPQETTPIADSDTHRRGLRSPTLNLCRRGLRSPTLPLQKLLSSNPEMYSCYILGADGKTLMVEPPNRKLEIPETFEDSEFLTRARLSGKPASSPFYQFIGRETVLSIAYPLYSPDKTYIGAITVQLGAERMLTRLKRSCAADKPVAFWFYNEYGNIFIGGESSRFREELKGFSFDYINSRITGIMKCISESTCGRYIFTHDPGAKKKPFPVTILWTTFSPGTPTLRLVLSRNLAACINNPDLSGNPERANLAKYKKRIQARLDFLASVGKQGARALAETGLSGEESHSILRKMCARDFNVIAYCITVSPGGKILAVEPPLYKDLEGTDIGEQDHIKQLHKTRQPQMSSLFGTKNEKYAVDIQHPIFSKEGTLIGSVGVVFIMESFPEGLEKRYKDSPPVIIQKDGWILYSPYIRAIGVNLDNGFTPCHNPGLVLLRELSESQEGAWDYHTPWGGFGYPVGRLYYYWTTVSLYGKEWRLVESTLVPEEMEKAKEKGTSKL